MAGEDKTEKASPKKGGMKEKKEMYLRVRIL